MNNFWPIPDCRVEQVTPDNLIHHHMQLAAFAEVAAVQTAVEQAARCTAAMIGILPICRHWVVRSRSIYGFADSTVATQPVLARRLPNACRTWWHPSPAVHVGRPRRKGKQVRHWAEKPVRDYSLICLCRQAPIPSCD